MKKKRSYSDSVHFYGIIWDIAALLVFMMIPVSICLHLNVWPEAKYILKGLLPVAMIFYPSAVIEVLTYTPLLGAGGTYLGFVTGNITNLKLPCGLNAMENAGVRANSEEGEVVSTIAIATSSIVTTVIIALGVLVFSPLLPYITAEDSPLTPAFNQVVPALFGARNKLFPQALEDIDNTACRNSIGFAYQWLRRFRSAYTHRCCCCSSQHSYPL